jgi:hypothetical protein
VVAIRSAHHQIMITAARRFALLTALTLGAVTASTVLAPAATTHDNHRSVAAASPSSALPADDILGGLLGTVGGLLSEVVKDLTDAVGDIGLGGNLLGGA